MNDQQEESVSGEMKWNENKTMLKSVENNDVEIDLEVKKIIKENDSY